MPTAQVRHHFHHHGDPDDNHVSELRQLLRDPHIQVGRSHSNTHQDQPSLYMYMYLQWNPYNTDTLGPIKYICSD